jgi:hypothetical protein
MSSIVSVKSLSHCEQVNQGCAIWQTDRNATILVMRLLQDLVKELVPLFEEEEILGKIHSFTVSHWICGCFSAKNDIRYHLIDSLVRKQGSVDFTAQKLDLYLRLEGFIHTEFLPVFPKKAKFLIWEKISEVFLERGISIEESKVEKQIKLLSFYPDLLKKFGEFYNSIIGLDEVKIALFFDVIFPILMPFESLELGIIGPNAILLYGPPRCGKTLIANMIARTLDCPISKQGGRGSLSLDRSIRDSETAKMGVVFIREASSFFPSIEGSAQVIPAITSAIRQASRSVEDASSQGVLLICSTMYPDKIDSDMFASGRIDRRFYIPPPDQKSREIMFQKLLEEKQFSPLVNVPYLATNTNYYTYADLTSLIEKALAYKKTLSRVVSGLDMDMEYLQRALSETRAPLSSEAIAPFERVEETIQSAQRTRSISSAVSEEPVKKEGFFDFLWEWGFIE